MTLFGCTKDDADFSRPLTIANRKHDVVALRVYDKRMIALPDVGLMKVQDSETGQTQYIDTSSKTVREAQRKWWIESSKKLAEVFTKSGVDNVDVVTDGDYVKALMKLFSKRI